MADQDKDDQELVQRRQDARKLVMDRVAQAIKDAMADSPDPHLVLTGAPMALAGLAGAYVLQLTRSGILGDGENDAVLDQLDRVMRDMADPSQNTLAHVTPPMDFRAVFGRRAGG